MVNIRLQCLTKVTNQLSITLGSLGYPSNIAPHIVINNARRSIGEKWNLVDYNCQHFATECHDIKHSPQLQQGVFALGLLGVMLFITRGKLA